MLSGASNSVFSNGGLALPTASATTDVSVANKIVIKPQKVVIKIDGKEVALAMAEYWPSLTEKGIVKNHERSVSRW